jgi:hypothetical protein
MLNRGLRRIKLAFARSVATDESKRAVFDGNCNSIGNGMKYREVTKKLNEFGCLELLIKEKVRIEIGVIRKQKWSSRFRFLIGEAKI